MTIADFLAQAGFWQWFGMILLACALSRFRLFTITRYHRPKNGDPKL
jgi:hypothetical protein